MHLEHVGKLHWGQLARAEGPQAPQGVGVSLTRGRQVPVNVQAPGEWQLGEPRKQQPRVGPQRQQENEPPQQAVLGEQQRYGREESPQPLVRLAWPLKELAQ